MICMLYRPGSPQEAYLLRVRVPISDLTLPRMELSTLNRLKIQKNIKAYQSLVKINVLVAANQYFSISLGLIIGEGRFYYWEITVNIL